MNHLQKDLSDRENDLPQLLEDKLNFGKSQFLMTGMLTWNTSNIN